MFKEIVKCEGEWVDKSFITVSDKPGIVVEINEEGMKKYAIPDVPFFV
jgi:galactonate dehydratase